MANYIAFLDQDNIVTQVVQSPNTREDWCKVYEEENQCRCITTELDGSIRNKYARPGDTYYEDIDSFIRPSPYPSWILDKELKQWVAPVAKPDDGNDYYWIEDLHQWALVEIPESEALIE